MTRGSRLPTTLRIALISALLAFVTNAALILYVRYTTQTTVLADMRERVVEEARTMREAVQTLSPERRAETVARTIDQSDPDFIAGLYDADGTRRAGNAPGRLPRAFLTGQAYEVLTLPPRGEAGMMPLKLDDRTLLVSGERFGDALSLAHALERSLFAAMGFAVLLGGATGLVVAAYVHRRVRSMVTTIDRIGSEDFSARLAQGGSRDGFDLLATRINMMLDRIDRLVKELRVLTDSLAHDLRSPIGRLRTKVERSLLLDSEKQRAELLGSALLDADALTRQLTTVLEIGRAEAMTGTDRFEALDPAALVAEIAELYEPVAEECGIAINTVAPDTPTQVRAHRQLLTQALGNLIDNAIRHAPGSRSISIEAATSGDTLTFTVADQGPGIAPEQQAEARKRFGRLDAARSTSGAGLGLSLVEAVAHLHHGELTLSDNAPGLRATLSLPIDLAAA